MAYPRAIEKKKLANEGIIRLSASVPKPVAVPEVPAARVPAPVRINVAEQGAKVPPKAPKLVAKSSEIEEF